MFIFIGLSSLFEFCILSQPIVPSPYLVGIERKVYGQKIVLNFLVLLWEKTLAYGSLQTQ